MSTTRDLHAPWDPVQEPWRVLVTLRGAHLPHGWSCRVVGTYASEEKARERLQDPLPAYGTRVEVHYAENSATWTKNGRWRLVAARNRRNSRPRSGALCRSARK